MVGAAGLSACLAEWQVDKEMRRNINAVLFLSLAWRTEKFVLAGERNVGKVKNLPIRWRTLVYEV